MKPHLPQHRQAGKGMFPFTYSKIRFFSCTFSKTIIWRSKWKQDKFLFSVSKFLPTVCNVLWFVSVYVHRQEQLRKIVWWSDIKSDFQLFKANSPFNIQQMFYTLMCCDFSFDLVCLLLPLVTWICLVWVSFRSANKCTFLSYSLPFVISSRCLFLLFF